MKRKLCFILTALIFCTLISGCTGSDNEKSSAASSEKASQSEKSNEEQSKVIDKSIFDEKKIVLTFAAMSDIHQNGDTNSIAVKKFKSALKQLKIGYDLDLILVAGDMTDSGSENQIKQFKSTLQSVYTEAIPLVYSLGNHDGQGGLTAERFQKIYGDAYF
ncbi:MAG: metallophosphoesterase, partial [Clostridia bacterium]